MTYRRCASVTSPCSIMSDIGAFSGQVNSSSWTISPPSRPDGWRSHATRSLERRLPAYTGIHGVPIYWQTWRKKSALLARSFQKVLQVALEVGYESEAAFNRAFKLEFGMPPAQYRHRRLEKRTKMSERGDA